MQRRASVADERVHASCNRSIERLDPTLDIVFKLLLVRMPALPL